MKLQARDFLWLFVLCCLSLGSLLWLLSTLSISYDEAKEFFNPSSFGGFAGAYSVRLFGQNDFALRLPFLLLHFCNASLMFYLSKGFLKRPSDAIFATLLFCLLPGVNAVALLVSNAGIVIFFTLLLCIFVQKYEKIPFWLLIVLAFIDASFALLFLALIFYAIARKETKLILIYLILFALNMYCFGLEIGGHPKGYFLDTNGHLMLIFSPLLYLYFLYMLYRYFNAKTKPLMWYISLCALMFIWLLSLRQRVQIELFAPFLLLGIPLMVSLYFSGLRVRLPQFRARYRIPFLATFIVLLAVSATLFLSKPLFVFLPQANEHFAYRHFIAKELAQALESKGIKSIKTDAKMQERLKFYGISKGGATLYDTPKNDALKIPILYYNKTIVTFYLK
ncbi:hypothetical protein LS70_008860 [Helicobacter sp. MIT 11-5569]|uniref:hypothetical protein n=1 Tax=Helicobacter sp. MIT 11-5569 TaxID=1548151 RepID=UPI00051FA552|nr:hypothetical protein [Helicobacter sp. MIT 11-5569]TLD80670.1 hypothetical protein LS70_008860 [Helicobacter sp. MIT 11-5569]